MQAVAETGRRWMIFALIFMVLTVHGTIAIIHIYKTTNTLHEAEALHGDCGFRAAGRRISGL